MKVLCIENRMYNGNFELGKEYVLTDSKITCEFVHILIKEKIKIVDNEFEFGFCKFKAIN